MEHWIPTAIVTSGALVYSVWGYLKLRKKGTSFLLSKFLTTVLPPAIIAFIAAWQGQIPIENATDYITLVLAGFGFAKVQNKLGWN